MPLWVPTTPESSLQRRLDAITANTRALVPADRLARTEQVIHDLQSTGIEERLLVAGSMAPEFSLLSAQGKKVHAADLYALGPVMLKFFRGRWCPYDMTELEAWQQLYPELRERGALLVGISPQTPRQNGFTAERHHLTFPMLSDPGAQIAAAFGLAYTVPEDTRPWYRSMLVNIPFLNGDETWRLPLPGTVVIAGDNSSAEHMSSPQVRQIFAFCDHRVRTEPESVLSSLDDRDA